MTKLTSYTDSGGVMPVFVIRVSVTGSGSGAMASVVPAFVWVVLWAILSEVTCL